MRILIVIFTLFVCCWCLESGNGVVDEERAKKKKATKFWSTFLLLIISKIAITKIVYSLIFWVVFQKVAYIAGWVVNVWLKHKKPEQFVNTDNYNNHHDYNTIGYSYGPPKESEHVEYASPIETVQDLTTYGVPHTWPYSRRSSNDVNN